MAVRDLGVRPYAGERHPPSASFWVMWRLGLRRVWRSKLVKAVAFLGWIPGAIGALNVWVVAWVLAQNPETAGAAPPLEGGRWLLRVLELSVWLPGFAVTLGAGAGIVARDLTDGGLPFFLSKPVTPGQYVGGQAAAVSTWLLLVFLTNTAIMLLAGLMPTVSPDQRLEVLGLAFPAFLYAVAAAASLGVASVGVSALGRSRALTLSAWAFVFVVPQLVGNLVAAVADVPWVLLASLPALLGVVGDALFKVTRDDALRVWHAAPILVAGVAAISALAVRRVERAEVVT